MRKIGRVVRQPNKTEKEFELILRARFPNALIYYEPFSILVDGSSYKPDYMVCVGGIPLFYEVKGGFKYTKDVLRLKAAAAKFPFPFTLAEKLKTGWQETVIRGLANIG